MKFDTAFKKSTILCFFVLPAILAIMILLFRKNETAIDMTYHIIIFEDILAILGVVRSELSDLMNWHIDETEIFLYCFRTRSADEFQIESNEVNKINLFWSSDENQDEKLLRCLLACRACCQLTFLHSTKQQNSIQNICNFERITVTEKRYITATTSIVDVSHLHKCALFIHQINTRSSHLIRDERINVLRRRQTTSDCFWLTANSRSLTQRIRCLSVIMKALNLINGQNYSIQFYLLRGISLKRKEKEWPENLYTQICFWNLTAMTI